MVKCTGLHLKGKNYLISKLFKKIYSYNILKNNPHILVFVTLGRIWRGGGEQCLYGIWLSWKYNT